MFLKQSITALAFAFVVMTVSGCSDSRIGQVPDEAKLAGRPATDFKSAEDDYFADMDYGYRRDKDPNAKLTTAEVRGRNTWNVWTFGNDRFWDYMANHTFGAF